MNWYKIFYWLTVADNVKAVFLTLTIVCGIFTMLCTIGAYGAFENAYRNWESFSKRIYKIIAIIFLLSGLLWTFTPSKTDCLLIIAGGSVGNFITSDSSSQKIPADITKFLHLKLQDQILNSSDDIKRQLDMQTPKEKLMDKVKDLTKEQLIEYLKNDSTLIK